MFTKLSIKQTLKRINELKNLQTKLLDEFYRKCYLRFVEYCTTYLYASTIGEDVKDEIANGWQYERLKTKAKFVNKTEKAVYVEFGVGIVGKDLPHKNAKKLGNDYKYNIGTKIKEDGSWIFNVSDDNDIDIQQDFIDNRTEHTVMTKGSPAVMYAYNALVYLTNDVPKIWQEVERKYWG